MSYEISGFDPTSPHENPEVPFSVWHDRINGIGFHVVHAPEVYRRLEAGQKITLVDYEETNKKSNIATVTATAEGGENYASEPADLYSATIALSREKDWHGSFIDLTDDTTFTRLTSGRFHWTNSRILSRPNTSFAVKASIYSRSIEFSNQSTANGATGLLLLSTRLSAPARKDVLVGDQMLHFVDSLSAMLCVANSLGKDTAKSPGGDFIMTPDGPLYKNPDTGEYVHRLDREKVTLSGSAKKPEKSARKFDQLFGMEEAIDALNPIVLFYTKPELAKKWGVTRPGNVFLTGPGGVGKTALIEALAGEMGADLLNISPAEIYGKWVGDTEKAMKALFDNARKAKKPTILFFDELEGIVNIVENDTAGSRVTNAAAGIFKTESARICDENPYVILAAASNNADRIDPAIIRAGRFDLRLSIGLPNENARRQLFGNLILNRGLVDFDTPEAVEKGAPEDHFNPYSSELLQPEALESLAKMTECEFSAADIIEVLRRATLRKASEEARTLQQPEQIDLQYLTSIIAEMRRNHF